MLKKDTVIVLFIFSLALFLRSYNLDEKFNFNAEYNYKLWPIKEIIYDHKIRLIGIEAVSYLHHLHYPPMALYLFAPILLIGKGNPISIEIVLIILSSITGVLLFYLVKKVFSRQLAFLCATLYAISSYIQLIDRFIWVVGTMMFFTTIFFILMIKLYEQRNSKAVHRLLFLSGLVLGLSLNFHFQATVLVITALAYIYHVFRKKLSTYGSFLIGLTIPISPLILFEFRHSFYNSYGFVLLLKDSGGLIKSSSYNIAERTFIPLLKLMAGIIIPQTQLDKMHIVIPATVLLVVLLVLHFRKLKTTKLQKEFFLISLFLIILGFFTFPFVQNRFYRTDYYLYYLAPVFIILLGFALQEFIKLRKVFSLIILGFGIFVLALNLKDTFVVKSSFGWSDQKSSVKYILLNSPKNDFHIKFTDTNSEDSDYLFYFMSKRINVNYNNIHYVERWNTKSNVDFIVSTSLSSKKSKSFGPLKVTKRAP